MLGWARLAAVLLGTLEIVTGVQVAAGTVSAVGLPTLSGARLLVIAPEISAALRIFPSDTELALTVMTRSRMWMRLLGKKIQYVIKWMQS